MLKLRLTLQKPELTIWDAEWAVPLQRVKVVSETQHKCSFSYFLRLELKSAVGIFKVFYKNLNFQLILKLDFLIKSSSMGWKYFYFFFL